MFAAAEFSGITVDLQCTIIQVKYVVIWQNNKPMMSDEDMSESSENSDKNILRSAPHAERTSNC